MSEDKIGALVVDLTSNCAREEADWLLGVLGVLARAPVFFAPAPLLTWQCDSGIVQ
jgi:hypothetical protein